MATLGQRIDALAKIRDEKRALEEKLKAVEDRYKTAEGELIEALTGEGMEKATGRTATVSLSTSVSANVEDWDKFFAYIKRNNAFYLLQRRVTDTAYREILDSGKSVPGVTPFNKTRLNLRSLKQGA